VTPIIDSTLLKRALNPSSDDERMSTKKRKSSRDLEWPRLIAGTLLRRYQRFKADVKLRNGHRVTAHCPNTGSMRQCCEPGRAVFLSRPRNKGRLKYRWEMIDMPTSLVGVNTMVPNTLVKKAAGSGRIPELAGYDQIRSEVRYGSNSRIDLLLEKGERKCYVEVKNCTLVEDGIASFPDAVTTRGLKHLVELQKEVRKGHRAVMLYLVQRADARHFQPAGRIDPAYARELKRAAKNGVEVLVFDTVLDMVGISLHRSLPYDLDSTY